MTKLSFMRWVLLLSFFQCAIYLQAQSLWRTKALEYLDIIDGNKVSIFGPELVLDEVGAAIADSEDNPELRHLKMVLNGPGMLSMRSLDLYDGNGQPFESKLIFWFQLLYREGAPSKNPEVINVLFDKIDAVINERGLEHHFWKIYWLMEKGRLLSDQASEDSAIWLAENQYGKVSPYYLEAIGMKASRLDKDGDLKAAAKVFAEVESIRRRLDGPMSLRDEMYDLMSRQQLDSEDLIVARVFESLDYSDWFELSKLQAALIFERAHYSDSKGDPWVRAFSGYLAAKYFLRYGFLEKATTLLARCVAITEATNDKTTDQLALVYDIKLLMANSFLRSGEARKAYLTYEEISKDTGLSKGVLIHNMIIAASRLSDQHLLTKATSLFLKTRGRGVSDEQPELLWMYADLNAEVGNDSLSFHLLQESYDESWSLVEFRLMEEQEALREEMGEYLGEEETDDIGEFTLEIGTEGTGYLIGARPSGDDYQSLLSSITTSAYKVGMFEKACDYALQYRNVYYDGYDSFHQAIQTGSSLGEIYAHKNRLFPFYDLFLAALIQYEKEVGQVFPKLRKHAFNQSIDTKGSVLFEYRHLRQTVAESKDSTIRVLYNDYLRVREEMVDAISQNDEYLAGELRKEVNLLRAELSGRSSAFRSPEKQFTFWNQVRDELREGEVVVDVRRIEVAGDLNYVALILKHNSAFPEMVLLKNPETMEKSGLSRYLNAIKFKVEDQSSYDLFWKPIDEAIGEVEVVYFSPDGVYNQISLRSLKNPSSNQYLLDKYDLINIISPKVLTEPEVRGSNNAGATLIGRPSYSISHWDPEEELSEIDNERALSRAQIAKGEIADLPGTEIEVTNIQKVLKQGKVNSQVFLGAASTELSFKEAKSQIIHVATHGFWFDEAQGQSADAMFNSGLLFAGVKNHSLRNTSSMNDGILSAYEIQGLNLSGTELVVLSACETGKGKVEVGEGVFGLQRALTIAGVDKLIMSLWKVDDAATQMLFSTFYRHWIQQGIEMKQAFTEAQQLVREQYSHPYYWGAFVLVE